MTGIASLQSDDEPNTIDRLYKHTTYIRRTVSLQVYINYHSFYFNKYTLKTNKI